MCDYVEQDVTGMDRLDLASLLLAELDDPDTRSVQLEKDGRRLVLRTYLIELDLSALDSCAD